MTIRVVCPDCDREYQLKEQMRGKTVACKECGATIKVGAKKRRSSSKPSSRSASSVQPKRSRSRLSRSSGDSEDSNLLPIIAAVSVGLAVIAVVTVIVLLRSGKDADPPVAENENPVAAPAANGGVVNAPVQNSPVVADGASGEPTEEMLEPLNSSPLSGTELKTSVTERVGRGMSDMTGVLDYWDRKANHTSMKLTDYSAAPKSPTPVEWKVEVDPGEEISYEAKARRNPIEITIPSGSQNEQAKDIVFPVIPSRVISVGQHSDETDRRLVYDIPTKTNIGLIRGFETETTANALSPGGKFFAGLIGGAESRVKIWDIENKAVKSEFPVPDYPFIAMPTESELLLVDPIENAFVVLQLDGSQVCEFTAGKSPEKAKQTITFSPGGKYVAVMVEAENPGLKVFEISTGDLVGETTLPHYEKTWGSRSLSPLAIAFSPNGKELAYATEDYWQSKLVFIDVASAQLTHHLTLKQGYSRLTWGRTDLGERFSHGLDDDFVPLRWFPDNKHILIYEHAVMQTATGEVVHLVPKSAVKFVGIRYPVAEDLMTVLNVSGKKGAIFVYGLDGKLPPAPEREGVGEADGPIERTPSIEFAQSTPKQLARNRMIQTTGSPTWSVEADPVQVPALVSMQVPVFSQEGILASIAMRPGVNVAAVSRHSLARRWGGALTCVGVENVGVRCCPKMMNRQTVGWISMTCKPRNVCKKFSCLTNTRRLRSARMERWWLVSD